MHTFVTWGQTERQNIWSKQVTSDWMAMTPCPLWHTSQFQFKPCKCIFCHVLCYVCKCFTEVVTPVMFCLVYASVHYPVWLVLCFFTVLYCTVLLIWWWVLLNQHYLNFTGPWRESSTVSMFELFTVCWIYQNKLTSFALAVTKMNGKRKRLS